MDIRAALLSDKKQVLDFCKTTFTWGDYISDVWDYWISEGNLLVLTIDKKPVGICHLTILNEDQAWIEGIRVNESFRQKGFATNLVQETEKIAKQNNCNIAKMLIETNNTKSLKLAEKLNYAKEEKWDFYSLIPKETEFSKNVMTAKNEKRIIDLLRTSSSDYIRSWRWIPLTKSNVLSLIKGNRIFFSEDNGIIDSLAILFESDHFEKTLILTLVFGHGEGLNKLLSYVHHLAFQKNYAKIQILTKLPSIPKYEGLEKKYSFFLMKKVL